MPDLTRIETKSRRAFSINGNDYLRHTFKLLQAKVNDSRFGLGYVPIDKVIGKAFVKIWPPSRFGLLH